LFVDVPHILSICEPGDVELVIAAVLENAELKANLPSQIAGIVPDGTLIASNASSIPIAPPTQTPLGPPTALLTLVHDTPWRGH
jgi:hypothetical protein